MQGKVSRSTWQPSTRRRSQRDSRSVAPPLDDAVFATGGVVEFGATRVARISLASPRRLRFTSRARLVVRRRRLLRVAAILSPRRGPMASCLLAPPRAVPPRAGLSVAQDDNRLVDFYELLGVADDADVKTIKRAYYDMAM